MNTMLMSCEKLSKTDRKLFYAYSQIISSKSADEISVTELCEKADINRSTFYRNYYDIADLKERMHQTAFATIKDFCKNCFTDFEKVDQIISSLGENRMLFENAMWIVNTFTRDSEFTEKVYNFLIDFGTDCFTNTYGKEQIQEITQIQKFMLSAIIIYCVINIETLTADVIIKIIDIVVYIFKTIILKRESIDKLPFELKNNAKGFDGQGDTNRAIWKTKRSIYNAFIQLVSKKSIDKITVSKICEIAEVSHSTFYNHYKSIEDFVDSIRDAYIENSISLSKMIFNGFDDENIEVNAVKDYVRKNRIFFGESIKQERMHDFLLSFPQKLSAVLCNLIGDKYECNFDIKLVVDLIIYASWYSLYLSPESEENKENVNKVISIALEIGLIVFTPKKW